MANNLRFGPPEYDVALGSTALTFWQRPNGAAINTTRWRATLPPPALTAKAQPVTHTPVAATLPKPTLTATATPRARTRLRLPLKFGPPGYLPATGNAPLRFWEPSPAARGYIGIKLAFGPPGYHADTAQHNLALTHSPQVQRRTDARLTATLPKPTAMGHTVIAKRWLQAGIELPAPQATTQARVLVHTRLVTTLAKPQAVSHAQLSVLAQLDSVLAKPRPAVHARLLVRSGIAAMLPAPQATARARLLAHVRFTPVLAKPHAAANAQLRVRAQLDSVLAKPRPAVHARLLVRATLAATLPKPVVLAHAERDINVYRDPSVLTGSDWQSAPASHAHTAGSYGTSGQRKQHTVSHYRHATPRASATQDSTRMLPRQWRHRRVIDERGAPRQRGHAAPNRYLPHLHRRHGDMYQHGDRAGALAATSNRYLPALHVGMGLPYEQASALLASHWGSDWQTAAWHPIDWQDASQNATWPPPGISPYPETPTVTPPPLYVPDETFVFGVAPGETRRAPIQRTYLVSNTAHIRLRATGQALDASAISVAIDADSWAWELRATVIGHASIELLQQQAQPVELEATLNGHTWRVVLDDWQRSQAFGNLPTVTLSARSIVAYLGAPYAQARSYVETQTRTAQQLAEQELPIGWSLDWQIDDWLVESGAWHYTNRTPIDAITAIATAAGATVQAHPHLTRLIIAPRYAAPHWAWHAARPDITLPPDVLTRLGSDYQPKEPLNAVYVSGDTTGVLALVKRTGTAGDRHGEMVVDPLITRHNPARGRGISVLSASGEQTRETLALPVADDIVGLLENGQLLRVDPDGDNWRGVVRSVSLRAQRQNNALVVEQTAEIERHLEETA